MGNFYGTGNVLRYGVRVITFHLEGWQIDIYQLVSFLDCMAGRGGLHLKKIIIFVLAIAVLMAWPGPASAQEISLYLDGQEVDLGVNPVLVDGRVLVPLRSVFERLGAEVNWNEFLQRVEIKRGSTRIHLTIASPDAKINGVSYQVDVPSRLVNGRTMVPLRFISQALGAHVVWDGATQAVHINSQVNKSPKESWGFYVDYQSLGSLQNNLDKVSAVLPFSYTVSGDGSVQEKVFFAQGYELARGNGIPVYAVIFQNDKQTLHELLSSEESRANFIESVYGVLANRQYQGVNLDFEGVSAEDRDNYTALVKGLHHRLSPEGYKLSLSVPAKIHDNFSWQKGYDYQALGEAVDYLVLMAYDQHYSGGEPGPVAALGWVERVASYAASQVASEKIILGLGLYGYDWPVGGKGRVVDLEQVNTSVDSGSPVWDEEAYSPGLRYLDSEGVMHEVWYENDLSIMGKLELVKKYKLAGFSLWRLGLIPAPVWSAIAESNN